MSAFHLNYQTVVPIFFREHLDREHIHIGTGFVIAAMGAHAVVITAAHVLLDIIHRVTPPTPPTLFPDSSNEPLTAISSIKHEHYVLFNVGTQTLVGEVTHAWGCQLSDLAILCIDIPLESNTKITQQLAINSTGPQVADKISVHGYFDVKDKSADLIPSGFESLIRYAMNGDLPALAEGYLASLNGQVKERFPDGVPLVRGACFRVDQPFNSGMSGGPVIQWINEVPVVCGVISHDDSDSAYGTGKWAIASELGRLLDLNLLVNGQYPLSYTSASVAPTPIRCLRDLVRLGVIKDLGA